VGELKIMQARSATLQLRLLHRGEVPAPIELRPVGFQDHIGRRGSAFERPAGCPRAGAGRLSTKDWPDVEIGVAAPSQGQMAAAAWGRTIPTYRGQPPWPSPRISTAPLTRSGTGFAEHTRTYLASGGTKVMSATAVRTLVPPRPDAGRSPRRTCLIYGTSGGEYVGCRLQGRCPRRIQHVMT